MKIDILLATFNGEKYLASQLDSIFSQTFVHWRILARDDGSTDKTIDILAAYAQRYSNKIEIIKGGQNNIGACQNFAALLDYSQADYVLFCDQDDIWFSNKIQLTLDKMLETEKKLPGKPVLIHTDLKVVDEQLTLISDSMWDYQNLDLSIEKNVYKLAVHNVVTGCTVMINKAAKKCSCPIPNQAIMHDWWIAINVCQYGFINHLPNSTILYRQHSGNDHGAKKKDFKYYLKRIIGMRDFSEADYSFLYMIRALDFKLLKKFILINLVSVIVKNFFCSIVPQYKKKNNG